MWALRSSSARSRWWGDLSGPLSDTAEPSNSLRIRLRSVASSAPWSTWWRLFVVLLSVSIASGCAAAGTTRPPLRLMTADYRPAIIDRDDKITEEGVTWLNELVNLYLEHCAELAIMRGEKMNQCWRGIKSGK